VLKFGGTSLSSSKDINSVAKTVASFSKKNEIVVVCSAVDGVTDDLILISRLIEHRKKNDVAKTLNKVIKKHKSLADQTIKNLAILKKLKNNNTVSQLSTEKSVNKKSNVAKEIDNRQLQGSKKISVSKKVHNWVGLQIVKSFLGIPPIPVK